MGVLMGLTLLLLTVLFVVNAIASVVVIRLPLLSSSQRRLQLAFIWLVPLVGAVICVAVAHAHPNRRASPSTIDSVYLDSDLTAFDSPGTGSSDSGASDAGSGGGGDGD